MAKINIPCEWCGKPNLRWASQLATRKYGVFCDRDCLGKFRTRTLVGSKAANFKTGSRANREYIEVHAPWHPNKGKKDYVSLHRLLAEAKLGRFLTADEIVHHRDHDKTNNHWANLEVMTQSEHMRLHFHSETA